MAKAQSGAARKGAVKKSAVKKSAVKKGAVKKGAVRKGAAGKGAVRKGLARKGAVRKGAVKKGAASKVVVMEAAAGEAAVQERPVPVSRVFIMRYALLAVAVTVSLAVYAGSLESGFVYDDITFIVKNEVIKDPTNIASLFFSHKSIDLGGVTNYYRPLPLLFVMADYHIFGLDPWGFHHSYIILHALVTAAVFLFAAALVRDVMPPDRALYFAFASAILFATHPVNTEVVAWNGAGDLLMALFLLSSFRMYMAGRHRAGAAVLFLAALSKETAVALPLILAAYDLAFRREEVLPLTKDKALAAIKRYGPYLGALAVYMALRSYAIGWLAGENLHASLGAYEVLINIPPVFAEYLYLLIFPFSLTAAHTFDPVRSVMEFASITAVAVAAAYIVCLYLSYKRSPVVFLSLVIVAAPLIPVFYIPALGMHVVAERRLYLSSVGGALILACAVPYFVDLLRRRGFVGRRGAVGAAIAAVLATTAVYSYGTITRSPVWKDNMTLWEDTVRKSPRDEYALNNLAVTYIDAGRYDEAMGLLDRALSVNPEQVHSLANYGNIYMKLDRTDDAIAVYERIRQSPAGMAKDVSSMEYIHDKLGEAYLKKGDLAAAEDAYRDALAINRSAADARFGLGNVYYKAGRMWEAVKEYKLALALDPAHSGVHFNLGVVYYKLGYLDEATGEFEAAVSLDKDSVEIRYNLASAYHEAGRLDVAAREYRRVLDLDPAMVEARTNLAIAYAASGRLDSAINEFEVVVRLRPASPKARYDLAVAYNKAGRTGEAKTELMEALDLAPRWFLSKEMAALLSGG